jgi:predicted HicB family RNase H-like nuclease
MTTLRYKDYQGSVEFEDGHLVVRILHIDDLITTNIDSATAAQKAFEELVDDYVATCAELGKEPCKTFKGSFNVRVSPELHRLIAMAAADLGDTMNAWIMRAMEAHIERQKTKKVALESIFVRHAVAEQPSTNRDYSQLPPPRPHAPRREREAYRPALLPPALERQRAN